MSRPQEFDRDDVLDRALLVFWRKGFEAASIQDLVDATGLNRGSLYNSFGDKAALFAAVMDSYLTISPTNPLVAAAQDPDSTVNVHMLIVDFFAALVTRAQNDGEHKGCLFTNTAAGAYGCSDAMSEWVREALGGLEEILTVLVKRGQQRGDLSATAKPSAIARSLIASAQGLNVMARAEASPQVLEDIATMAVRVLDK